MVNKYNPGGITLEVQFTAIAEGKEQGLKCLWFDILLGGDKGAREEKKYFLIKTKTKKKESHSYVSYQIPYWHDFQYNRNSLIKNAGSFDVLHFG